MTAAGDPRAAGGSWTIAELGRLEQADFVAALGSLFEGSPWIMAEAWETRPWASARQLHAALTAIVADAGEARQLALIRAHPDLVGRAALAGTLTRESTAEQRAAGLDPDALSAAEIERFRSANAAYKAKFGFPFVICARENRKESILAGLSNRLSQDREAEVQTALAEIGKIAWFRLADIAIVGTPDQASPETH